MTKVILPSIRGIPQGKGIRKYHVGNMRKEGMQDICTNIYYCPFTLSEQCTSSLAGECRPVFALGSGR